MDDSFDGAGFVFFSGELSTHVDDQWPPTQLTLIQVPAGAVGVDLPGDIASGPSQARDISTCAF